MKSALLLLSCLALATALAAPARAAAGPQSLGVFGDWTAAAYGTGADRACYAFTTVKSSSLALPRRGAVLLTVTQRKSAPTEVTLAAGYTYPKAATVTLEIGTGAIDFYTSGQTAFTTGGAAAVSAFQAGAIAVARSSGPRSGVITDNFSLAGFSGAYAAIKNSCL